MIDFSNIEKYKENNRIEAKKAIGGLPLSIWETYSAFGKSKVGLLPLSVKALNPTELLYRCLLTKAAIKKRR